MNEPLVNIPACDRAARFKMVLGFFLCGIYATAYAGFVVLSVYDVSLMDTSMLFGLNLGIFYGIGLILLAFLLGFAYNAACTFRENMFNLSPEASPDASSRATGERKP